LGMVPDRLYGELQSGTAKHKPFVRNHSYINH
jgi:hypothetical protein